MFVTRLQISPVRVENDQFSYIYIYIRGVVAHFRDSISNDTNRGLKRLKDYFLSDGFAKLA